MTADQERWAETVAIERVHGGRAAPWVAERMDILALAWDAAEVERFREIAARLDGLPARRETPA